MTRYFAIKCDNCGNTIISRARHDWNCCSCYTSGKAATDTEPMVESTGIYIDGDSIQQVVAGYIRVGGSNYTEWYVDLPFTRQEVYLDYFKNKDELLVIDTKKYPLIPIQPD